MLYLESSIFCEVNNTAMTTNYENIKNMTVDEMAEFMTKNVHKVGKFYMKDLPRLEVLVYADGFKQWLLSEVE